MTNSPHPLPRIAIIAHDSGSRGAERVVVEEAVALRNQGWDVTVFAPSHTGSFINLLEAHAIKPICVKYYWWMGPGNISGRVKRTVGNLFALPTLLLQLRQGKFDIVHSHSITCSIGAIASRLLGIVHVWHLHESGPYIITNDQPKFDFGPKISLLLLRWTKSHFIAVSKTIAKLYQDKFHLPYIPTLYQRVTINPTPHPSDQSQLDEILSWHGPKIIVVGALVPVKDPLVCVHAMAHLKSSFPTARLFFVGSDPIGMGNEIDRLAEKLQASNNLRKLGTLHNAAPAIFASDVCVISSIDEGLGRVTIEAMLLETPIVAADLDVNREVLDSKYAEFFAPSDPIALAAAISNQLNKSQKSRVEKTNEALEYAENTFGSDQVDHALDYHLSRYLKK